MRCPECSRFVSTEAGESSLSDETFDAAAESIQATISIVDVCAECGTELRAVEVEVDEMIGDLECGCTEGEEPDEEFQPESDWECAFDDPERSERKETTNPRTGRPISLRHQKTIYDVSVGYEITCARCHEQVASGTLSTTLYPSDMEEVC